jgi:hypothetical protein
MGRSVYLAVCAMFKDEEPYCLGGLEAMQAGPVIEAFVHAIEEELGPQLSQVVEQGSSNVSDGPRAVRG